MSSRKPSARARETRAFKDACSADAMDGLFSRESAHQGEVAERREEARRYKPCDRKKRYATRAEAEAARIACERHGARSLHVYQCPYCDGWHLTHKSGRQR